jgi:LmbE family N-acetylglucosaminyl deacetylase
VTQPAEAESFGLPRTLVRDDQSSQRYDEGLSDPFYRRYRALRLLRFVGLAAIDLARLVREGRPWPAAADEPSPARRQQTLARLRAPDPAAPPSVLLIAAHADDETLWAMSLLRSLHATIRLVYVTDSAPRGDSAIRATGHATRSEYSAVRRDECRRALALLGIGDEQVIDLGLTDQESRHHLVQLTEAIEAVFDRLEPEIVVTHAYEGGHPDHDATAYAVHMAARRRRRRGLRAPQLVEFAAYHRRLGRLRTYGFLPAGECEVDTVTLDEQARRLKREMRACFASQTDALHYFPVECERFRAAPRYDFHRPPNWERVLFWDRTLADQPNRTLSIAMVAAADAALTSPRAHPRSPDVAGARPEP